jgi:(E)-4-hydroxy-3-methylbut-2-enyl-diphosphate synthase
MSENTPTPPDHCLPFDPFIYQRRATQRLEVVGIGEGAYSAIGGSEVIKVAVRQSKFAAMAHKVDKMGDFRPDFVYEEAGIIEIDPRDAQSVTALHAEPQPKLVSVRDGLDLPVISAFRQLAAVLPARHSIVLKDTLQPSGDAQRAFTTTMLTSSAAIGSLLCDGVGDAILVQGEDAPGQSLRLAFNILQAAGSRIFKTDYVACPSCGRTLFNLQETTARIKASTVHLKGVKIAIMGCIVNGPGEMADADFGYVGGAPGKINLYIGKQAVKFNIPEAEAVDRLIRGGGGF